MPHTRIFKTRILLTCLSLSLVVAIVLFAGHA